MFKWLELGRSCARGILIAYNVLIIFVAAYTLSCVAVDLTHLAHYGEEAGGSTSGDIVIIVICGFMVLVAVMGFVGAVKKNEKILCFYVMLLAAFMLLEAIIGIFVSVERYGVQWRVTDFLRDDFYSNNTDVQLWDTLQSFVRTDAGRDKLLFQCCGINGPEDYASMNRSISISCCGKAHLARNKIAQKNMFWSCLHAESYFSIGCEDAMLSRLQSDADIMFVIGVVSIWIDICSMFLATVVIKHAKNSIHVYKHTV